MNNCKLCITKIADKTGSHIIPHFLMKRIDNEVGKNERDKEIGFTFRKMETTSYFGQSILPEKLDEVYGNLSDSEIEKNKIPHIIDNIFCTDCELKLSQIENEYSKTIKYKDYGSKLSSEICFLFWVSILWRISISKNNGLILKSKEEELLRRILNKYLTFKIDDLNKVLISKDIDCQNLFYRLIRCPDYSLNEATVFHCNPFHRMPYCILIDEYVLFFYFKKGHIDNLIQDFFGFEKELKGKSCNTVSSGEKIILYTNTEFKKCISVFLAFMVKLRLKEYDKLFDEVHRKLGGIGSNMPNELKQSILNKIILSECEIGKKYSFKNVIEIIYEELKKYIH